jgi:peptidyl-prolyl cis-trans isomerase C
MKWFREIVLYTPVACLLAQAPPPKPVPQPAAGQGQAQPAVNLAPAPASQPLPVLPTEKVVITVGDEKITAGELNRIIQALPEQFRASTSTAPGRKQFVDNYVRLKILAQEGKRRKLDQDAAFQVQMTFQHDNLLAASTYNSIAQQTSITDEQIAQYYAQHKNEFESVRAVHVLIRFKGSPAPVRPGQKDLTEEEALAKAQALRKEILAGGDFAAIAKRESDDAGSGAQGGDLGVFHRGQMVPSFEEAAFALPIGQLSEPVKTMFGYHLIKVSQRDAKSLADVRAEIDKKLRPEAAMKAVEGLQKSTNVVIDPQLLGEEKK